MSASPIRQGQSQGLLPSVCCTLTVWSIEISLVVRPRVPQTQNQKDVRGAWDSLWPCVTTGPFRCTGKGGSLVRKPARVCVSKSEGNGSFFLT